MPQSSERLMGIYAEISSSVGKIALQNQHDFEQVNCFDSLMKTGQLIVFFLGDICRWSGMVEALCSSYGQTSPFVRTGCYEIKPEVAFYSLPQSFKQTKKTVSSHLCSVKSLLYSDAYEKLRSKW